MQAGIKWQQECYRVSIPRWAWDISVAFSDLARGREKDVSKAVRDYLREANWPVNFGDARSITRLAALTDLVDREWPDRPAAEEARFIAIPRVKNRLQRHRFELEALPLDLVRDEMEGALKHVKGLWEKPVRVGTLE